jgi:sugar phosphate isomerase/epimerase
MNILFCSGVAYKTHTLQEIEEVALSLGYAGLEIMPPPAHLPPDQQQRDTDYASVRHAPVVHGRGDIYTTDAFKAALDETVIIAKTVGAITINMHPASRAFGGRQNVLDGIAYMKEVEAKTEITIAYELLVDPNGVHPDRKQWFAQQQAYDSIEDWITDVKEYDLAATLDTCHIGTWGRDPEPYIEQVGKNLKHVHFSDFNTTRKEEHLMPGEGNVHLVPFLRTLNNLHPDITLTMEISPKNTKEEVEADAKRSIEYIQQALLYSGLQV